MKKLRILKGILVRTRSWSILLGYLVFVFADAFVIMISEPDIHTYRDALWYCYAVISTAGFGDIVVATAVGKTASVILTVYSVFVIAIVTGVVVNFYNQIISLQQEETITAFMDKLEQLPDLSREELVRLSQKTSFFRKNFKNK